jgi:hypothetical protein
VGNYQNNPLVREQGMSIKDAKSLDKYGKGGGLVDGVLCVNFRSVVSHNSYYTPILARYQRAERANISGFRRKCKSPVYYFR